ncbi:MAG: trimethylamine methyltransferase family protein [Deltaproteobacteria bacterium]|nr:trimethylamine methyltransferase family protein [Deltaproteobacteria bacterium]
MPKLSFSGGQLRFLSEADVVKIHEGALRILAEAGLKVPNARAFNIYKRAGAQVHSETQTIRLPLSMVERALADAPSQILLAGREESNDLLLVDRAVYAGTGGAELHVIDLETGKLRDSTLKDVADIARLVDALEHIDFYIRPVVAQEIPQTLLDVNKYYASLANTSKHVMGNVYFPEKVPEIVEMAAIVAGGKRELKERPIVSFITSWMLSPLTLNAEVTEIVIEVAKHEMPLALSSVAIMGLTSPVTMAANLALTHAEQLAGIVLCQLTNPGTPVIYGGCPGVADMKDMSFIPGSIERQILNAAISQLAQHINVPNYNLAGVTDAKIPDAQAGYEKAFGLALTALAGSNYIHHAAGRIKDGVAYEQYVIDNEIIGMAKRAVKGIIVNDETLAIDQIIDEGSGANYLASEHTMKFFRDEFFNPRISDRKPREAWEDSGCLDTRERARLEAKQILKNHRPQDIPKSCDAQIRKKFEIVYSR